jgi:hypothetical protein
VKLLAVALLIAAPSPALKVTYWPHGRGAPAIVWTLGCAPATGTHPVRGRSCLALRANAIDLGAATKPCTILARVGAPEAQITGMWKGKRVDRSFRSGCPGWSDLHLVLTGS